jgi:hypothetical protein
MVTRSADMVRLILVFCITLIIAGCGGGGTDSTVQTTSASTTIAWPLKLSSNGLYFVDQSNKPFIVMGDSAWSIEVMLSQTDVITYLNDRKAKGFTAILFSAMEHFYCTNPPANYYGEIPFINGVNDWSARNEDYWSTVDFIVQAAKNRDMLVIMAPAYFGLQGGDEGWYSNMNAQTDAAMTSYGTWIGNRYKDYGNVIWIDGVDADAASYTNGLSRVNAIAYAIKATSASYLQTAGSYRTRTAIDDYNHSWLDLNTAYVDTDPHAEINYAYNQSGAKPTLMIEGEYEPGITTRQLQSEALIAYLGGCLGGHFFGNETIWCFNAGWKAQLGSDGSVSMGNIAKLLKSRMWWNLVPDYGNRVVTSNKDSGYSYKATARTSDGRTVMIWNPTSASVTVDMTRLSGSSANVWSWNPNNNSSSLIGTYATTGTRTFTPTAGTVLVLDDARYNYANPGTTSMEGQ